MKRVLLRRPGYLGARPAGRCVAKGVGEEKVTATITLHHPPMRSDLRARLRQDGLCGPGRTPPPSPGAAGSGPPAASGLRLPRAARPPRSPNPFPGAASRRPRGPGAAGSSAPTPRRREVCSQSVGTRRHPNSTRDPTGSAPQTLTHPRARSIHAPGACLPQGPHRLSPRKLPEPSVLRGQLGFEFFFFYFPFLS